MEIRFRWLVNLKKRWRYFLFVIGLLLCGVVLWGMTMKGGFNEWGAGKIDNVTEQIGKSNKNGELVIYAFIDAGHNSEGRDKEEYEYNRKIADITLEHLENSDTVEAIDFRDVKAWYIEQENLSSEAWQEEEEKNAGFRAYVMRSYARAHDLDPNTTIAVQIHNDLSNPFESMGTETFYSGDRTLAELIQENVIEETGDRERDLGLKGNDYERQSFIRGATGKTYFEPHFGWLGTVKDEEVREIYKDNDTKYGPELSSATLIEVAHYKKAESRFHWLASDERELLDDEDFIKEAGVGIAEGIEDYVESRFGK